MTTETITITRDPDGFHADLWIDGRRVTIRDCTYHGVRDRVAEKLRRMMTPVGD